MPSHYLNQCKSIVNCTLRNKSQLNLNRNSNLFIQEYTFENVVCEMASILSRPQFVIFDIANICSSVLAVKIDINLIIQAYIWHLWPLLLTCLTLIPAGIIYHMPSNVWDEIIYPFSHWNGGTSVNVNPDLCDHMASLRYNELTHPAQKVTPFRLAVRYRIQKHIMHETKGTFKTWNYDAKDAHISLTFTAFFEFNRHCLWPILWKLISTSMGFNSCDVTSVAYVFWETAHF